MHLSVITNSGFDIHTFDDDLFIRKIILKKPLPLFYTIKTRQHLSSITTGISIKIDLLAGKTKQNWYILVSIIYRNWR